MKRFFERLWVRLLSRLELAMATRCVLRANGGGDRDLELLCTSWRTQSPDLPDPIKSITKVDKAKKLILLFAIGAMFSAFIVGWYDWVVAVVSAVTVLVSVIAFWPGNILSVVSQDVFDSYHMFMMYFMGGRSEEDVDSDFEDLVQD
jgi:hypothetical protein